MNAPHAIVELRHEVRADAGSHQIDLVNEALGYKVSRSVSVAPGKVETVTLRPPMGSIAINAIPWAEVWVDGEKAGDTPIGNFPVAIGKHVAIDGALEPRRFFHGVAVRLNFPNNFTGRLKQRS